jgi:hypothetical protein
MASCVLGKYSAAMLHPSPHTDGRNEQDKQRIQKLYAILDQLPSFLLQFCLYSFLSDRFGVIVIPPLFYTY